MNAQQLRLSLMTTLFDDKTQCIFEVINLGQNNIGFGPACSFIATEAISLTQTEIVTGDIIANDKWCNGRTNGMLEIIIRNFQKLSYKT